MRSIKFILFSAIGFCSLQTIAQDSVLLAKSPLIPNPEHPAITREVVKTISSYHYTRISIDDKLSSTIFDRYIKSLDFNKSYFLQSDIDKFEKYRNTLDDDLKAGNLITAFSIFNTYRERLADRVTYSINRIKQPFDYTKNDSVEINREKESWMKTSADLDEYWNKRLQYEMLSAKLAGTKEEKLVETIVKRYSNIRNQLIKQKSEDAFSMFMNAFAEAVDPHTSYFSPANADNFSIDMSQALEGIGATLRTDNEVTKVVAVIKGGPAEKSGLIQPNDKIVGVGQGKEGEIIDVIGWRIDDVVAMIRGAKGTIVRLSIIPATAGVDAASKIIEIVREKVKLEEQTAKAEVKTISVGNKTEKVGVITVPSFYLDYMGKQKGDKDYSSTTKDVRRLLTDFSTQKVNKVIIDLRNNGGGSLQEAIDLTGLFITKGPVVQVKDAAGNVSVDKDEDVDLVYSGPLVVIVNKFSASASEIFAGAIQDYGRGIIVGDQTYGKGTVQNVIDINRIMPAEKAKLGKVKITLAKFYRVSGSSTQHRGVVPDLIFPSPLLAEEYGESSEPTALPWDQISPTQYQQFTNLESLKNSLKAKHEKRMMADAEYRYLLEDIAEFKRKKDENYVPIGESLLKTERDNTEEQNFKRGNERRVALGLKPLIKGETKSKDEKEPDLVLSESQQIVNDLANLTKK